MSKHLTEDIVAEVVEKIEPYMDNTMTFKQVSKICEIDLNLLTRIIKREKLEDKFLTGNDARKANSYDTYVEKYGSIENYKKHMKNATEKGMLEKYGVTHNSKLPETIKKRSESIERRTAQRRQEIQQRKNETLEKKYGSVENFWRQQREKSFNTKLERYGNGNYTNPSRIKKTTQERYGVENVFMLEEIKNKSKETCLEKYSVEYYTQSETCKERVKETMRKKYGVDWYVQSDDCHEKLKEFCQHNYGVDWFVLTKECIDKRKIKKDSLPNKDFEQQLENAKIDYSREFRLGRYIYDFKVGNTLVEINPFPTHNIDWGLFNNPVDKLYHRNKTLSAKKEGYSVIHVWDWDDKSKVLSMLNQNKNRIGARKCNVVEISKEMADSFLDKNHLQNRCRGNVVNIALYYDNQIISVMTFGTPRYNNSYQWELLRFCNSMSFVVIGAASKMFNYFRNKYNPKSVISYCDCSKFSGNVYQLLGFKLLTTSSPSFHWTNGKIHITDNLLRQRGFDQLFNTNYGKGTSNEKLMLEHGFVRVPDCGQSTYVIEFDLGE